MSEKRPEGSSGPLQPPLGNRPNCGKQETLRRGDKETFQIPAWPRLRKIDENHCCIVMKPFLFFFFPILRTSEANDPPSVFN